MRKNKKAQTEEEKREAIRQAALAAKEDILKNFLKKIHAKNMTDEDIKQLEGILTVEDYNELRGSYNDIIFSGFPYSKSLKMVLYHYLNRVFQANLIDGGLIFNMLSHGYISHETFLLLHDNATAICLSGFSIALHPILKKMLESGVKSTPDHETEKIPLSEEEKENFRILIEDFRPEIQLTLEEIAIASGEN